jgi:hypothetical protein
MLQALPIALEVLNLYSEAEREGCVALTGSAVSSLTRLYEECAQLGLRIVVFDGGLPLRKRELISYIGSLHYCNRTAMHYGAT